MPKRPSSDAPDGAPIRGVQDTAFWVAVYRAWETERPDALFRDPWASPLAGERGEELVRTLRSQKRHAWAYSLRTHLLDRAVLDAVAGGTDLVLNLAAGLDARPYRLEVPEDLRWVEVDHGDLLDYKASVLGGAEPRCRVESIALDLSRRDARGELLERLGREAGRIMVVTEGLLVYLSREEVAELATDLAAHDAFRRWATDLASPGLLRMIQKQVGSELSAAGAPLKFAPEEGPDFFEPWGWKAAAVHSVFRNAARLRRVPWWMRPLAWLPERRGGNQPWSGICELEPVGGG